MVNRFIFFALILICLSCHSDQGKQSAQIAESICKCYQPLMEINDKAQALLKSGKGKEAEKLISEMATRNIKAKECTLKLTKDARKDASLSAEGLKESIAESCPNVWASVKELLFE